MAAKIVPAYQSSDPLFVEKTEAARGGVILCDGVDCTSRQVLVPGSLPTTTLAGQPSTVLFAARETATYHVASGSYVCPSCFMRRLAHRAKPVAAPAPTTASTETITF